MNTQIQHKLKYFSKWSIAGISFGIVFAISSFIRYFIIYPNKSEGLANVIIGILIIAVSYLYGEKIRQGNDLEAIGNYLADLDDEREEVKNE